MRAVDPGSRLSRWRTIAAYGVALAPSLNSFRVGATRTTAAEAIVAPVAIIMAALSLSLGRRGVGRRSVRLVGILLWLALMVFLIASVPRWILADFTTGRRILTVVALVGGFGGAATCAGLLFDDGAILKAMRSIILANALVTMVEIALSMVLGHGIIMPWQNPALLTPYRPCGWFMEPSHYGAYVMLWAVMDKRRPALAWTTALIAALLAGGSIISLLALVVLVAPWTVVAWRRRGAINAIASVFLASAIMILALQVPAVQLRLSQLGDSSAFARTTKTWLVLPYLGQTQSTGVFFGYGPKGASSLVGEYEGSLSSQVLASGDYLNGWGDGIVSWGIVGVLSCWLVWIAASHRMNDWRKVLSVAFVLAVLQTGADYSPTTVVFWIPALVMGSSNLAHLGIRSLRSRSSEAVNKTNTQETTE
jgi:hypothetical protein